MPKKRVASAVKPVKRPKWPLKWNRKIAVGDPSSGGWLPRVTERNPSKGRAASLTVRCGCCKESVVISVFDEHLIEINGVLASKVEWQKILGPLLNDRS